MTINSLVYFCPVFTPADFKMCPVLTKGHIGHLLHFFMPFKTLLGLGGAESGTFALTSLSFKFAGRL